LSAASSGGARLYVSTKSSIRIVVPYQFGVQY
jgi:hypothetical protein